MNIFFLHETPELSAKYLVDKHVVKMPLESAQMLSTVHRLLDGVPVIEGININGKVKQKKRWLMPDEIAGTALPLYKVAHASHPSTLWTMQNSANYNWHFELFCHMLKEYTHRYKRMHRSSKLLGYLANPPKNIAYATKMTDPTPAMPDIYKVGTSLESYRQYYAGEKWRFAKWTNRDIPSWMEAYMDKVWKDERFNMRKDALVTILKKKTKPAHELIIQKAISLSDS